MIATIVNCLAIIVGGTIGSIFGNRISEKYTKNIMTVMALVTFIIGIQGAVGTSNVLIVVICMVLGTVVGTAMKLDDLINNSGEALKARFSGSKLVSGRFGDAFVTSTLLFGVGTMAILGSIKAGLNREYGILFTKSIMDFTSAIAFSAALGPGVIFSDIPILIFQGGITLLAGVAEPYLTAQVITEMSAVGGPIFMGMAINLLGLREERVKVGDMLPAIFMPIIYFPVANLISSLL